MSAIGTSSAPSLRMLAAKAACAGVLLGSLCHESVVDQHLRSCGGLGASPEAPWIAVSSGQCGLGCTRNLILFSHVPVPSRCQAATGRHAARVTAMAVISDGGRTCYDDGRGDR